MAETVAATRLRSYLTGALRFLANCERTSDESTIISLPRAARWLLVHFSFRGWRFILKFLWHLDRQKRNCRASLRTNVMPFPGKAGREQKWQVSTLYEEKISKSDSICC